MVLIAMAGLVVPLVTSAVLTSRDHDYYTYTPQKNAPKMPRNIITRVSRPSLVSMVESLIAMFSSKLDNDMNELMARVIANSEEFFLRFLLQYLLIVVMWQIMLKPERVIKAFH